MSFTEIKAEELKDNPFDLIGKQWMLITAGNEEKCNTMTASWGGVGIMWGKPTATAYIRDSRYTKEFLDNGDLFSLSFLNEDYRDALNYCGSHSGRGEEDKFAAAGLTKAFRHDIPYPDEANLVFLCRKMAAVPVSEDSFTDSTLMDKWYSDHDMHMMYVGEIVEVTAH